MPSVSRNLVHAFFEAFVSRDPQRIGPYLADDIEWTTAGPVDVLPFCGSRRGKAAALDYLSRVVPQVFRINRFEPEDILIDGDRAAMFSNARALIVKNGRLISYRCAHFVTFRDDKVMRIQGITDTYDMVEQAVGHRINAYYDPTTGRVEDVVAL